MSSPTASPFGSPDSRFGLLTGAGSLGLLFPPSLPVILYGITSKTPVDQMFLGALLPGLVMLVFAGFFGVVLQRGDSEARSPFDLREAARAVWEAKWELALPVVVLVGLFGGFATLVEVAAATALYAFAIETFVYRDLRFRRDLRLVAAECGVLMGGVLIILGVALGFTNYLIDAEISTRGVEWVQGIVESKVMFLLLLNAFLLVVLLASVLLITYVPWLTAALR